jgi:hypothetical protein
MLKGRTLHNLVLEALAGEEVIDQAVLHQRQGDPDLSAATVVAQRCRVERGVF